MKVRKLVRLSKVDSELLAKVDSELLLKVSIKNWQRKFQSKILSQKLKPKVSIKSWNQKFQSRVDSESFSQKLTPNLNAKIVREVALWYCKQINNGRYQCNAHLALYPAKNRSINDRMPKPTQQRLHLQTTGAFIREWSIEYTYQLVLIDC